MGSTVPTANSITGAAEGESGPVADRRRIRRAVIASGFGTVVEYFDFSLYAFFATTIADTFFPAGSRTTALLYTFGIFGASFVMRPLGGILLGHIGDKIGRRPALGLSVGGMALASALIGCVPSYAEVGMAAPLLLLCLRCVQGLSAGGEIGGAQAYVIEVAPDRARGYLTGLVSMGVLVGTLFGALSSVFMHTVFDARALAAWAWRLPFLISLPLGIVTLVLRSRMEESQAFTRIEESGAVERMPVMTILRDNLREVLIVCGVSSGNLMLFYMTLAYMPTYLQREHLMSGTAAAWSTAMTLLGGMLTIPLWARLSDRLGRRPLLLIASFGTALAAYPAFLVMPWSVTTAAIAQIALGQLEAIWLSVAYATYCEQFPTRVRSSGVSLGCNLSSIIAAGPAPYVATWLIPAIGRVHAPALMLIVFALISAAAAWVSRETAGQSLQGE
ncbi:MULTISPECIES: MFS transporter [Paraburkholderia]|uniref:MFS transporter n=1 Tax=Paraburkholderia madseniana TaxID=2599607 RepID=A0AAP5F1G6_9BURK|nr:MULTISPECIES: MFS transporter [Paraburkholderia]MCX4151549.1 MFS transporter [Paraburkholderia madseniana]MDN7154480.1 MFS transporter [Paraburkholderia sp. WS6]MDQ6413362.1 MFS transporter [Paraburkholderia madseniana]